MEVRWEDLEKAYRNLRQIYLYLAATLPTAGTEPGLREPLGEILDTAESISADLGALAGKNGIAMEDSDPPAGAPGAASLDRSKLRSISNYLTKMAEWIQGIADAGLPPQAGERLVQLVSLTGHLVTLLQPFTATETPAGPDETPLTVADLRPTGPVAIEVPELEPLVLAHTFKEPLLRGVEGKFELTSRAVRLLDEFLEKAQLEYGPGDRRRFHRQVARWLEATPDGMVLTLRIGGLSGRPEPYPKYQPIQR